MSDRRGLCPICDRGFAHSAPTTTRAINPFGGALVLYCSALCARLSREELPYHADMAHRPSARAVRRALLARELTVTEIARELGTRAEDVSELRRQMILAGELGGELDGSNEEYRGIREALRGKLCEVPPGQQWGRFLPRKRVGAR